MAMHLVVSISSLLSALDKDREKADSEGNQVVSAYIKGLQDRITVNTLRLMDIHENRKDDGY